MNNRLGKICTVSGLILWLAFSSSMIFAEIPNFRQKSAALTDDGFTSFIVKYLAFKKENAVKLWWTGTDYKDRTASLFAWRKNLLAFRAHDLGPDDRVDYRLLLADIDTDIARFNRERRWQKDPCFYLPDTSLFYSLDQNSEEEKARILKDYFEELSKTLSAAVQNLDRPRHFFLRRAQERVSLTILFFDQEVRNVIASIGDQNELKPPYEKVLKALGDYQKHLHGHIAAHTDINLGFGAKLYTFYLRNSLLLDDNADSLLAKGERYFKETLELLKETARQIDANCSWQELILKNRQNHPDVGSLLHAWEREISRARAHVLEKKLVRIPPDECVLVLETPPSQRANSPFGVMETAKPESNEKIGRLIINPVEDSLAADLKEKLLSGHDYTFIRTIAPHETYPGHHLHALKIQENPRPLRKYCNSTLFTEGWGLYCEELMFETGYFPDNGQTRLTQLLSRLWRAARVILDVRLQTNRISVEDARRFLEEEVMFEPQRSAGEVNMYLSDPTYFITYIVGYYEIMSLREEYKKKMGKRFSLLDFHESLLKTGAIPVSLVRELLLGD